jgi:hypothetical protein
MDTEDLLRCLVHIAGRTAVPVETTRAVVGEGKNRTKAFNLCDGRTALNAIAKKTRIDQGNLSRAASIWVENGVAFWIGDGKDARLLHVYPLPKQDKRKNKAPKKRKGKSKRP